MPDVEVSERLSLNRLILLDMIIVKMSKKLVCQNCSQLGRKTLQDRGVSSTWSTCKIALRRDSCLIEYHTRYSVYYAEHRMHWRTRQTKNEKRRLLYRQKCDLRKQAEAIETVSSMEDCEDTRTRVAKQKALQRAKGALPNSPGKYVATVLLFIDTASP